MKKIWILLFVSLVISSCTSTEISSDAAISNKPEQASCDSSYPLSAALAGISGYVQLSYDIDEKGRPVNISVIKSLPENVFDEVGKCALSKWRYKPKMVNGVPVYQPGLSVQLEYQLENGS